MQKINLRELYPDVYKTDVFVEVAEEILAGFGTVGRLTLPMSAGSSGTRLIILWTGRMALKMMRLPGRLPRRKSWSRNSCGKKCILH